MQQETRLEEMLADLTEVHRGAGAGDAPALVALLDNPALVVRHAAHVELMAMSAGAGAAARYDPFADGEARARAIAAWGRLVAGGEVGGLGRVRLSGHGAQTRPRPPAPDPVAIADVAVRMLDALIAESRRPEAVEALMQLLDAEPGVAGYALACLRHRTGAAEAADADAFRRWWRDGGRQRFAAGNGANRVDDR